MRKSREEGSAAARSDVESELAALRAQIDGVDRRLLDALCERARLGEAIGRLKREQGAAVFSAARERDLVARLVADNPGPFPSEALRAVFREIISATRSLEEPLRIAYLGPEATFAHLAARRQFGAAADLRPAGTIGEVFAQVERGKADLGVVPVENTTQGVVTETLDAFAEAELTICAEIVLRVSHHLLSRAGRLEDVRRVASHPQGLAQCRGWLDRNLPGVERLGVESTAEAARRAASEPDLAAIGSAIAGETYGLVVTASSIEDHSDNTTRFLVLGHDAPPPSGNDLTSAVFMVRKDQAGALHRLLEPFARHGVNLASIQSRPIRGKPWEYLFYLDLEGHQAEVPVAKALADAAAVAHSHKVLGSFPRALPARASVGATA